MFYVYVIKNQNGKIYIGQTGDLEKRLGQHNDINFDKRSYTKLNKGKWTLIYTEEFTTRKEVIKREKELKTSRGRSFIRSELLGS